MDWPRGNRCGTARSRNHRKVGSAANAKATAVINRVAGTASLTATPRWPASWM